MLECVVKPPPFTAIHGAFDPADVEIQSDACILGIHEFLENKFNVDAHVVSKYNLSEQVLALLAASKEVVKVVM